MARIALYFGLSSILLLCALVALPPGRALIDRVLFSDDAALSEGLTETIALVHDTAAVAAASSDTHLEFDADHRLQESKNADPDEIDELHNNHSFADHSNSARNPGYNDCDAWRNVFDDGWSAYYAATASSARLSGAERMQILDAVRNYWESQGYDVQTLTQSQDSATYERL